MQTILILAIPIIVSVILVGIAIVFITKHSLPEYFKKKGENFALKQDAEQITELVKRVEAKYDIEIEAIKNTIQEKAYVRKTQFDKEFEAYSEIWSCLAKAENIVDFFFRLSLKGIRKLQDKDHKKLPELSEALKQFQYAVTKYKPFCYPEIYDSLIALEAFIDAHQEVIRDFQNLDKLYDTTAKIHSLINIISEKITNRIQLQGK